MRDKIGEKFGGSLLLTGVLNKLFFALVAAAAFLAPRIVGFYLYAAGRGGGLYEIMLWTLYASVVPALTALSAIEFLLSNIRRGLLFTEGNIALLRILSWCCFAMCAIFLWFSRYVLLGVVIAAAGGFFGMILRVLKNVFVRAAEIKEENDFTV